MRTRSIVAAGLLALFAAGTACGGGSAAPSTEPTSPTVTSPSASPTPSISPSPSFTPPATATVSVFGQIGFQVIVLEGAKPVKEPFDIILSLRSVETGEMIPEMLESNGNFTDDLEPGTYAVVNLQIEPPAFGKEPVILDTTGPSVKELRFTVPESGCLYAGRVVFTYVRLPKGGFDQQVQALQDFSSGEASFQFMPSGSVVYFPSDPGSHMIDLPKKGERAPEARDCQTDLFKYVKSL